ncbi:MAG: transposase [Phycisphaerae bacterium]
MPAPAAHRKRRTTWNEPGHAHELTFSCFPRLPLLTKERTRRWLIEALDRARQRWCFELWAYVIMPEHVHVLLYPTSAEYSISAVLKAIKQPVARRALLHLRRFAPHFLDRLRVGRPGRVEYRFWQAGGGYDRNIYDEATAWACVEYIHGNPARRELCAVPTDWLWSSARWYAGLDDVPLEMDACPQSPSLARGRRRGQW